MVREDLKHRVQAGPMVQTRLLAPLFWRAVAEVVALGQLEQQLPAEVVGVVRPDRVAWVLYPAVVPVGRRGHLEVL